MPKDAKEISAGLKKKGFIPRDGDHTFYHLYVNGKKTIISTKMSHGETEIRDQLLAVMVRQVGLSRRDFIRLVDCPLVVEEYLKMLRNAGRIAD